MRCRISAWSRAMCAIFIIAMSVSFWARIDSNISKRWRDIPHCYEIVG